MCIHLRNQDLHFIFERIKQLTGNKLKIGILVTVQRRFLTTQHGILILPKYWENSAMKNIVLKYYKMRAVYGK